MCKHGSMKIKNSLIKILQNLYSNLSSDFRNFKISNE